MVSGNDILEYEQKNAEELQTRYAEIVVKKLDFSTNNQEYWDFVEQEYSEELTSKADYDYEMGKDRAIEEGSYKEV